MDGETGTKDRGTILAEERTDLAVERSVMAAERTLMAWIRTSISMIGFGFTIYKFFQYKAEDLAAGIVRRPNAPRNLGLSLIAVGTLALIAATWQHKGFLKQLGPSRKKQTFSVALAVAVGVVLIGVITFYGVLFHSGPF